METTVPAELLNCHTMKLIPQCLIGYILHDLWLLIWKRHAEILYLAFVKGNQSEAAHPTYTYQHSTKKKIVSFVLNL